LGGHGGDGHPSFDAAKRYGPGEGEERPSYGRGWGWSS
jgi:hypothetical protein